MAGKKKKSKSPKKVVVEEVDKTKKKEKKGKEEDLSKYTVKQDKKDEEEEREEKPQSKKTNKSGRSLKYFLYTTSVALVVAALVGSFFVYREGVRKLEHAEESPAPLTTPTPLPTQTPTLAKELERENLVLQVLNGRGAAGTAAEAQEYLEGLGYTVEGVGNAESFDYEETEISIKEDKSQYLGLLVTDLESKYAVASQSSDLEKGSEYDAVIIIGAE